MTGPHIVITIPPRLAVKISECRLFKDDYRANEKAGNKI